MVNHILSIAGSDPSGGAGVQADLKTFSALGAYGMAVLTALTVQNTQGVFAVQSVPPSFLADQVKAILNDIRVDAIKIGMVGTPENIEVLADLLADHPDIPVVLDPVMVSTSGDSLSHQKNVEVLKNLFLPLASIVTPNILEAENLLGRPYDGDQEAFAQEILELGAQRVYLKGGHLPGPTARDIYVTVDGLNVFEDNRIETQNTHGTGCTLSSAMAVFLGQGDPAKEACRRAKDFMTALLRESSNLKIGKGPGPLFHAYRQTQNAE